MNVADLVKLTQRAWALPILARLDQGVPGRQAPLIADLGASRGAFAASLDHLIQLGLVERNPGHGHPLRPEFRLTDRGRPVAAMASRVLSLSPDPAGHALMRRRWTLPVLAVLPEPSAFGDIRARLGHVTDRALSHGLRDLEAQDWLARRLRDDLRPARPLYVPQAQGLLIGQAVRDAAGSGNWLN